MDGTRLHEPNELHVAVSAPSKLFTTNAWFRVSNVGAGAVPVSNHGDPPGNPPYLTSAAEKRSDARG
jgi:hypothetical protein